MPSNKHQSQAAAAEDFKILMASLSPRVRATLIAAFSMDGAIRTATERIADTLTMAIPGRAAPLLLETVEAAAHAYAEEEGLVKQSSAYMRKLTDAVFPIVRYRYTIKVGKDIVAWQPFAQSFSSFLASNKKTATDVVVVEEPIYQFDEPSEYSLRLSLAVLLMPVHYATAALGPVLPGPDRA